MSNQSSDSEVKVWDPFVRIFHWTLVFSFIAAYLTGDDENIWHIYLGYAIGALIVTRIIWGFVGGKYARFSNFVYRPSSVASYLKSLLSTNPKHYLGHNPAGGYMVVALLIMLSITTITGLKAYGVEGKGPLAGGIEISLISTAIADDDESEEDEKKENNKDEFWEEAHEVASNLTVLLVLLHIFGAIVSSRLHKENLVKAMITGKKKQSS